MKLLLDESVPRGLKQHFPSDFDVSTVQENGWASVKNGALLCLAADDGFGALITADKGFAYQHNQETLPVPVIILHAHRTTLKHLVPAVPAIVDALRRDLERRVCHVRT
jgi:predicted nuclease of predicted toxin-antitoxin system